MRSTPAALFLCAAILAAPTALPSDAIEATPRPDSAVQRLTRADDMTMLSPDRTRRRH